MRKQITTPLESLAVMHSEGHHKHHHHAHPHASPHHAFDDAEAFTKVLDDPARDAWQLPDDLLRTLALTPAMTVADVGAGTGYFAVRIARAVPRGEVIAIDAEPAMVRFLGERARREQLPNVRAVHATQPSEALGAESVDRILIVHVWHHLGERIDFARQLAKALRPGGKLFVVDFSITAHRGPPMEMRVGANTVIGELKDAGLTARVSPIELSDQYVVEACLEA